MKKLAAVYRRKGKLYIRSCSQTTAGVWIDSPSVDMIVPGATASETGVAVLRVLHESRQGLPHPTSWGNVDEDPLWGPGGLAAVRSWSSFVNGTSCVDVQVEDDWMTFSPSKNEGARDGFSPLPDKEIRLPAKASPDEIGAALERAFALCESASLR